MQLTDNQLKVLQHCRLWDTLSDTDFSDLLAHCLVRNVEAGQVLFSQGEQGDEVLFVVEGVLRAYMPSPEGKELTCRLLPAGAVVGDFAAIDQQNRSATVEGHPTAVVVSMQGATFRRALMNYPEFAFSELHTLVGALRQMTTSFYEHGALSLSDRLYRRLLETVEPCSANGHAADHWQPVPVVNHRELAVEINATREAVTRAFKQLQQQGLLRRENEQLYIQEPQLEST